MLNRYARAFFTKLLTPVAVVLIRLGVSPDVVTVIGRVGDAAIFGGLVLYFAGTAREEGDLAPLMAGLALACLILGSVVSYAKARAEGLGMTADVGIAERADRLVVVLLATGLTGLLDLSWAFLGVVLALLALASLVTVVQRMLEVRRQALGAA